MLAIDTLKLAEDLKEGGFDEKQTTTLVDLGRTLSDQALEKVATKEDLKALEERVNLKFDGVAKDMTALEHRMVIKLGSLIVIGVGFLVLLDRLFPVTAATG